MPELTDEGASNNDASSNNNKFKRRSTIKASQHLNIISNNQ